MFRRQKSCSSEPTNGFKLKRAFRGFRKDKKGATAVEFALIAPLLIMVIFSVLEVGRALYVHATLQHAVEVVGRHVIVNQDATSSELYAIARSGGLDRVSGSGEGVTFSVSYSTANGISIAVVTARTTHKVYAPFFSELEIIMAAEARVPQI